MSRLIGVTGSAQHGKNSVGDILVAEYGYQQMAFADALKSMALVLNPIIREYQFPKHPERLQPLVKMKGWEYAKTLPEVRRFLQVLGTEGVRSHLGDNAWVDALELRMENEAEWSFTLAAGTYPLDDHSLPQNVVITDVRFPNEAEAIAHWGGALWGVKRYTEDGKPFDNGIGAEHPSEAYVAELVEKADRIVVNDGSVEDLTREVHMLMGELGGW